MVTVACLCPLKAGKPRHPEGDTIELREHLELRGALTARKMVGIIKSEDPDASAAEILAGMTEAYVLYGVASWSVVDEKDHAVEPTRPAIREYLLSKPSEALKVADAADDLYSEEVLLPLLAMASTSLPPTPTDGSTSPTTPPSTPEPTPLRPSSTSTIPTDATGPTSLSLAGASSSSRSSA